MVVFLALDAPPMALQVERDGQVLQLRLPSNPDGRGTLGGHLKLTVSDR